MKKPKRKLSHDLTKRTKLSAEQLERARGQASDGLASRYTDDGVQSLVLTRRLVKASKKARKFILYSTQLGKDIYLSNAKELYPLTFDIKQARQFIVGFDDPKNKVNYWNLTTPAIQWMVKNL